MNGSSPPALPDLPGSMDKEVGTVASQIFERKVSWDNLVAVHTADPFLHRLDLNRSPAEKVYAQRLRDTLTEQFGGQKQCESVTETLLTYLIDRSATEWPAELKKLAGMAEQAA